MIDTENEMLSPNSLITIVLLPSECRRFGAPHLPIIMVTHQHMIQKLPNTVTIAKT